MKSRTVAGMTALMLGGSATWLHAQFFELPEGAGPYFRADLGPAFFQNGQLNNFGGPAGYQVEYDTGFAADTAIGYAFNNYVATDFELGYVGADIRDVQSPGFFTANSTLYNVPFLANLMLSYPIPNSIVVPYIGAGVGGSAVTFDTDGFGNSAAAVYGRETDVVFAWQAFAGLRFKLNDRMLLGIGYQYFATANPTFNYPSVSPPGPGWTVGFDGVQTHAIMFTFQMKFW